MSAGVPVGASNANHDPTFIPGTPDSPNVGTLGSTAARFGPVTARATSRFDSMSGRTEAMVENIICDSPDTTAAAAGPPPLYGMWATSILLVVLNNSATSDKLLPVPPDAYRISPGRA